MRLRVLVPGLFLAVGLNGCGTAEAACGKPFAEAIDSNSSVHILPGVTQEPKYKTNPPTSGAHRVGGITAGVTEIEIDKPDQVHALESGSVLVQYKGLAGDALEDVRSVAGEHVVVAPNKSLKKTIVATAWLHKMECTSFDATALNDFIDDYAKKHDGH